MRDLLKRHSGRSEFRAASAVLIILSLVVPLSVVTLGAWAWLAFMLGLPVYAMLIWLTYYRLQDASLSSGWIVLMLMVFHFGPKWGAPEPFQLYLSELLNYVPVIIGWIAPSHRAELAAAAKVKI